MVLYINSCVRAESRTDRIARALLEKICGSNAELKELKLDEMGLQPLSEDALEHRTELIESGQLDAPEFELARQFAEAEVVVISAPYWDLSFPASLKTYFENIYISGIVSEYDENGIPHGLCRGGKLYYVTTAGGPYDPRYSYEYVKTMATEYFGIGEVELIKAEMLDVQGFDAEAIVSEVIAKL